MGIEEMWPQPGAASESMPKGYEDKPNREELLFKRGEYIDKAAKKAMKMEKEELEVALNGDAEAIRNLVATTKIVLLEEQFGKDVQRTEKEDAEFEKEYPNDVVKGYVEEALEDYKRDQKLK